MISAGLLLLLNTLCFPLRPVSISTTFIPAQEKVDRTARDLKSDIEHKQ